MSKGLTEVQEYLILLIGSQNDFVAAPFKTVNMMWMLAMRIPTLKDACQFKPTKDGPDSDVIDKDLKSLLDLGFITDECFTWLTPKGLKIEAQLLADKNNKFNRPFESTTIKELIDAHKKTMNRMSGDEIAIYVLFQHPEILTDLKSLDVLKPHTLGLVFGMLSKKYIDLDKAATLLGKSYDDTLELAKRYGAAYTDDYSWLIQ